MACAAARCFKKKKSLNPLTVSAALAPDVPENPPPPGERACLEHLCYSTANIKINHAFLWVLPPGASAYIHILLRDWSHRKWEEALTLAAFCILKCHHSKTLQPPSPDSQRTKFPRVTCGVLREAAVPRLRTETVSFRREENPPPFSPRGVRNLLNTLHPE